MKKLIGLTLSLITLIFISTALMSFEKEPESKEKRITREVTLLDGTVVVGTKADMHLDEFGSGYYILEGTTEKHECYVSVSETGAINVFEPALEQNEMLGEPFWIIVCDCSSCGAEFGDLADAYSGPCISCGCGNQIVHPYYTPLACSGCCCFMMRVD